MDDPTTDTLILSAGANQSRRALLGGGLGGLVLAASGLLLPDAEPAEAAKHRASKRRRRRRKDPGNGLLRNFAFNFVNNSNTDRWFGVGWQGFFWSDIPQRTIAKHSTRRLLVENDIAVLFVPNGTTDSSGNQLGRVVGFNNPSVPEVYLDSYSGVTYFLDTKSIHAEHFDPDSDQDMAIGGTRTFDFGFLSFVVHREQDSQKYKEFTITLS